MPFKSPKNKFHRRFWHRYFNKKREAERVKKEEQSCVCMLTGHLRENLEPPRRKRKGIEQKNEEFTTMTERCIQCGAEIKEDCIRCPNCGSENWKYIPSYQ